MGFSERWEQARRRYVTQWNTRSGPAAWFTEREEERELFAKLQSGQLYREAQERKKREKEWRLAAKRVIKKWIWRDGQQYFPIRELAKLRCTRKDSARDWAQRRPSLLCFLDGHLYCRNVPDHPPERRPAFVERDGYRYYSTAALAAMRGVQTASVSVWAKRRPHLCIRVGGRVYVRDEGYTARVPSDSVVLDGVEYLSVRELARRRGLVVSTVRRWAEARPHLTVRVQGRMFVRDAPYSRKKAPPVVWEGLTPYYSIPELARRRGVTIQSTRTWTQRHPHLCLWRNGARYGRDEEYRPADPGRPMPNRTVDVPPWRKGMAARRRAKA